MNMRRLSFISLACAVLTSAVIGVAGPTAAQGQPSANTNEVRVGDRIIIFVEGDKALTDSFTVAAGPSVVLPLAGTVSLAGVQRQDIEAFLTKEIGKFFRNPVIRVRLRTQMRLAIMGEVTKPGFYDLPTEGFLTDAINIAGGPTREAKLKAARVERADTTLIKREVFEKALTGGTTLGQLGLRTGDQLVIPRGGAATRTISVIAAVVAIPASLWWLISIRR
jgi:protein involved in polysaccharide export with SLBB domain